MNILSTPLIDTHTHLDAKPFSDNLEHVILRAEENNVGFFLTVGCDLQSSRSCIEIAHQYPNIYASVGIHPHDARCFNDEVMSELKSMSKLNNKVVAIGETGLDYYRNHSPHADQQRVFRHHIQLAIETGKPLIIHDRDAHEDIIEIMVEEKAEAVGGVMHCFSGDLEMAQKCIEMGFYISFAGPLTYPKNIALRQIAEELPVDMMLLETDCPYLSPQPWRGKRCEPAYLKATAQKLAEVKGLSLEDIARITSLNA